MLNNNFTKPYFTRITFVAILLTSINISAYEYKVPPSSSTSGSVPYISDQAMEECVMVYNDAIRLKDKIDTIQVDRYSQQSVDNYNNKVNRHSNMTNKFNRDCAGKQSYSAWKAAQKLNNR